MSSLKFTNYREVPIRIAKMRQVKAADLAAGLGITERTLRRIVTYAKAAETTATAKQKAEIDRIAEQKAQQIISEAQKKAEIQAAETIAAAEQKAQQIIAEAQRKAEIQATETATIAETTTIAEQKAEQIIAEVLKKLSSG